MKNNVGQLSFRGLVSGILICLAIGMSVYAQFNFQQRVPPQDAFANRLNDLEKKSIGTQVKLDQMQETLNQIRARTSKSGPDKLDSKKRH